MSCVQLDLAEAAVPAPLSIDGAPAPAVGTPAILPGGLTARKLPQVCCCPSLRVLLRKCLQAVDNGPKTHALVNRMHVHLRAPG